MDRIRKIVDLCYSYSFTRVQLLSKRATCTNSDQAFFGGHVHNLKIYRDYCGD